MIGSDASTMTSLRLGDLLAVVKKEERFTYSAADSYVSIPISVQGLSKARFVSVDENYMLDTTFMK